VGCASKPDAGARLRALLGLSPAVVCCDDSHSRPMPYQDSPAKLDRGQDTCQSLRRSAACKPCHCRKI